MKDITNRLRRVSGQITSLEEAIAKETPCAEVVPQLLAVKGAVNGLVKAYLENSMENCLDVQDEAKMRDLIKTFIAHS